MMGAVLSLIALIVVLCVIAAIRIARTDTDIAIAAQAGRPQPGRAPIVDTRFRCMGCDYQTDSPPGAINHHGATHHRMVEREARGLNPVTVTDGEVEEIGGGGR